MNFLFILAFYFVQVEGMSELQSGLIISTLAIVSMLVTAIVTPLAAKRGSSLIDSIGLLTFIVASYLFSQIDSNFTTWDYIWRLIIVGIGAGCTLAPYTTTAVLSVPIEKSGVAASICNISRTVGSIVGVAILVIFLNHQLLVEKEKVNREVVTVIKKSDLSNLEREQVLQAINKKQRILLKTDEEGKIYKQLKEKYKQGIIRSYNVVFLMGSIIFFIAFAFNIGRVIINKKRSKRAMSYIS